MATGIEAELHIALPVVVGLLVGILEAFFVYEDENMTSGRDFIKDMWHGLLFALLGVLIASNVPWLMANWIPESLWGFLIVDGNGNSVVVSILITLIMFFKMVASHKIKGVSGAGFSEKPWHKLIVAALIGFAPYYILALSPMLEPITSKLPEWMH
jgi:hypothetical protein